MVVSLLGQEVANLCLGKPSLRSLSASATVTDALDALKSTDEESISVWRCNHSSKSTKIDKNYNECNCECIGKISMVDIICYLSKDENNLSNLDVALKQPVSVLLPEIPSSLVVHVHPFSSLLEAIDLMLEGAQNLVIPIKTKSIIKPKQEKYSIFLNTKHNGCEFCWLTQQDILHFLLASLRVFSPIVGFSIEELGVISKTQNIVDYNSPASAAIGVMSGTLSSVAVVDQETGKMVGEIFSNDMFMLVAAAVATLSVGDLLAYIDLGGPLDELLLAVKRRLEEKGLAQMLPGLSALEEKSRSIKMGRKSEVAVCHRKSSLVAVMIQAITCGVNYVWVVDQDCTTLVGVVTFLDILKVLRGYLEAEE